MQRRPTQTKVHNKFFHFVSKETTQKPPKIAAAKNFSSSVNIIDTTCFNECFFISFDNWKSFFFYKSLSLLREFFSRHIVAFFEPSVLKEIRFLRYLQNISAVLIRKVQKKAIVYFT